ncbi:hypothetical protein CLV84_2815 [Neolewinella xylanilytica]|uniref:Lipocalin-like domain-containing protein n=1 Tax=Neolewinella xylanilytica TaxID=1514080 RepID=A0A2S6I415_9BACT|nr:hypothetical protein [Neolewinella xylanilytica]PPK85903.1 hypothetical protein CLV84_2815 [Neolewinella xylanilytica]
MRPLGHTVISAFLAVLVVSCDPNTNEPLPPDGLPGEWKMVSSTGLITYLSQDPAEASRFIDTRMIEPSNYRISFHENPQEITSLGATTLERTRRNSGERDTLISAGAISGKVSWELAGSTLTLTDEQGYRQESTVITLNEGELAIAYDVVDSFYMPYFLTRSQATQIYERR